MPLRRAHFISCISSAIALLVVSGCQQPAPANHRASQPFASTQGTTQAAYTTQADRDAKFDKLRREEIQRLLNEALSAPAMDQRTAAALAAADRATGGVADTFHAISAARDLVIENLRNVDTTGYKAIRARVDGDGQLVVGLDVSQGYLEATDRSLDVAIQGEGFVAVKIPDSSQAVIGYTRSGNFFVNNTGDLVLGVGDGYELAGPITVPTGFKSVVISVDGVVRCVNPSSNVQQGVGRLQLVTFPNPSALRRSPSGLYLPTKASGSPVYTCACEQASGQILSGFLERSNVDVFRESVRMRFLMEWRASLLRAIDK